MRGWVRGNMKIDPVLDVKVCYHQGRYGVEIMMETSFRDRTISWVLNRVKYDCSFISFSAS